MKTSNIFLIALFSLTLLVILGSNLVLKAEFDKIDRKNPLYGYKTDFVKPFKYVQLTGKAFGLTEIHPGERFEISGSAEKKYYDWTVVGDTLVFNYKREWQVNGSLEQVLGIAPTFFITAPVIKSVSAENVAVKIKNWKSEDMLIEMKSGALLLSDNTIRNLNTEVLSGGLLKIDGSNQFDQAGIQIRDSSGLKVEKDIFKSFKANVDTAAHIELPGSLYKNMDEN